MALAVTLAVLTCDSSIGAGSRELPTGASTTVTGEVLLGESSLSDPNEGGLPDPGSPGGRTSFPPLTLLA